MAEDKQPTEKEQAAQRLRSTLAHLEMGWAMASFQGTGKKMLACVTMLPGDKGGHVGNMFDGEAFLADLRLVLDQPEDSIDEKADSIIAMFGHVTEADK